MWITYLGESYRVRTERELWALLADLLALEAA